MIHVVALILVEVSFTMDEDQDFSPLDPDHWKKKQDPALIRDK